MIGSTFHAVIITYLHPTVNICICKEELCIWNGGMGIAVYILAAVIAASLIAFVLYRRAVKKKREKMYE